MASFLQTFRRRRVTVPSDERYLQNRIGQNVRLGRAILEGDNVIDNGVALLGEVSLGRYTTVGHESTIHGKAAIGRYCQIAPHCAVYGVNHNQYHITTYVNQRLFEGRLKNFVSPAAVEIGHDVWVGFGAVILPGVKIGSGTIIGAGAVVTKDISEYSLAVGNPARVIRKRFPDDITQMLLQWQWWNLSPNELAPYEELFSIDISQRPEAMRLALRELLTAQKSD